MTESFVGQAIKACRHANVPVTVDPKLKRFAAYREVDLFKPNLKELNEGPRTDATCGPIGPRRHVACSRGAHGETGLRTRVRHHGRTRIVWMHAPNEGVHHAHIPALPSRRGGRERCWGHRHCRGLSCWPARPMQWTVAAVANLAGGWVCERVGVVPITREALKPSFHTSEKPTSPRIDLAVVQRTGQRVAL